MNKTNNYKDKMFNSTPLMGGLRPNIREPLSESSNDISGIFDKPLQNPQMKNTVFRTPPRSPSFLSRRYSLSDVGATSVYNQQSVLKNNGLQSPQHRHLSRFNSLNTSTQLDTQSPGYVGRVVRYSEEREKLMPTHQPKYGGVGVFPIVHLFKKDLPTLKRKPSRVTVRIASPELSRYNTPEHNRMLLESIVHTSSSNRISPPQHSRMPEASTRSVLDALKEISRKRIHASEDIDLNEEKKRIRIDCLDSKKRNRDPDSPQQENAVSPNNRLSKKVCAMNELRASYSSSMPDTNCIGASASTKRKQTVTEISPNPKEAKQKYLVNAETQTTLPELTTTATNPEPERSPIQQQPAEELPEPTVQELQKTKKSSPPVKVFDEKPLEMMRKNRLQVLMGTLGKEKTKRTTIEGYEARLNSFDSDPATFSEAVGKEEAKEPRTPEKQTTPEKQLVSILSGPKKSPHKKHVTFNIPESSANGGENISFTETAAPPKFNSNCSVTQTSTAITTPIVSSGIAGSPIMSPPKELPKHNDDSKLAAQNFAPIAPEEKSVVPSFASPTVSSSIPFSFGSSPVGEPEPKPNPVTIANITLPKSLDVTSGSPGKKVGGFKFDLNKVSSVSSPFKSFGAPAKSPEGTANFSFSPKQNSFGITTTTTTTVILPLISTPATTTSSFGGVDKTSAFHVVPSKSSSSLGTNPSAVSFGGNAGKPPPVYGITTPSSNSFGVAKGSGDSVFGISSTTTTTTNSFSSFGSGAPPAFGANTNAFGGNGSAITPSFGTTSSTTTATPSFGGNIPTSAFGNPTTTTATPIFGTTVTTTSAPSFGVTSTPSFGAATTSAPFAFGAATSTSFSGFGTTTTPAFGAVVTTTPSFGSVSSTPSFTGAITSAPSFGPTATPSFGTITTTTPSFGTVTTKTPSFGTVTTTTPSFGTATTTTPSFGSATTTPSFGASSFGATTTAPPAYGSFGNTPTTTSAFGSASATAPPAFGSNFGAPPATTTSVPSFGGFNSTSTPKPFTFGNSNAPSFAGGSSSSITNPTFGTTVTSASNFGTQSTSSFTGPAMSTPSFNFGTTSSTGTTTAAPSFGTNNMFNSGTNPSFGTNSKTPPAFGVAGATPSGFGNTNASFGNGANTNTSFSGFGGPTTTTAENKFGSSTTPFMFGSTNTSFNAGSSAFGTPTTTSAFGSTPTTTPSFGQATPTPSFGTAVTTTSTFGVPSSTPSFSTTANGFGSSTTFGNGTQNPGFGSSSSTFGGPAPSSSFGTGNTSFGFGSAPSTTFGKTENGTSAFGQGGQGFGSATSAFNAPTTSQSGVFAFGSTANPPKPGAIFSFGSSEPPKPSFNFTGGAATSGTTFGGSNSSAPNFAPPGGFGGTPTPGQFGGASQPGPPGMFSIGTGSSTPNRARTQLKAKRRT